MLSPPSYLELAVAMTWTSLPVICLLRVSLRPLRRLTPDRVSHCPTPDPSERLIGTFSSAPPQVSSRGWALRGGRGETVLHNSAAQLCSQLRPPGPRVKFSRRTHWDVRWKHRV